MPNTEKAKVIVRPLESGDIEAVIATYKKAIDEKIPGVKRSRLSYRADLTYDEVASTEPGVALDVSFVAEIDGKIVGFIWGRLTYVGIPTSQVGVIHMLIVDPEYQRRGIAGELVNALAKHCKEKGVNTVRAVIDERDWELQNYFQSRGFRRSELSIYTRAI